MTRRPRIDEGMHDELPPVIGIPLALVLWVIVFAPHVRAGIANRRARRSAVRQYRLRSGERRAPFA